MSRPRLRRDEPKPAQNAEIAVIHNSHESQSLSCSALIGRGSRGADVARDTARSPAPGSQQTASPKSVSIRRIRRHLCVSHPEILATCSTPRNSGLYAVARQREEGVGGGVIRS
jgi:hypothetical protein